VRYLRVFVCAIIGAGLLGMESAAATHPLGEASSGMAGIAKASRVLASTDHAWMTRTPLVGSRSGQTQSYSDAIGDAGLAPDIGLIVVSHSGGVLTFRVGIANLGPGLVDGDFLSIGIDADRNKGTGCSGDEVSLAVLGQTGADFARLGRCSNGRFNYGTSQAGFSFTTIPGSGLYGSGFLVFRVAASATGTNFTFTVGSMYEGLFNDYYDHAGPFSYTATAPAPPRPPNVAPPPAAAPPRIARHPDVRVEATGPNGARVTYAPARVTGATSVSYSRPSGSVFPLGRTQVTITARKGSAVARSTFNVSVVDSTKPNIGPVTSVATNGSGLAGATVVYGPIGATDRVDKNVLVNCSPASGTTFASGITTVSCRARDRSGNTATATFKAVVPAAPEGMTLQTNTTFRYDASRKVSGATTALTISTLPPNIGGEGSTFTWATTSGTITGNGPNANWVRAIEAGQVMSGIVTVVVSGPLGTSEPLTIVFP
jgi:hypothetical protein